MSEEQAAIEATFEFVENDPIEATFSISPNIQDLSYVYYQSTASDTWTVEHNLGKYPSVTVVDNHGDTVLTDVNYIDPNTVEIVFNGAFSGKAYIN